MKKKLSFPSVDCKGVSKDNYVTISKNKLVKYKGIFPIDSIGLEVTKGKLHINEIYTVTKIDKHDRDVYGTNGTHIIASESLNEQVHNPCFIQLRWFEKIYVSWYLKKYIIQDLDFKKNLLAGIVGIVLGAILTKILS
nr:hypothetical protein [uncultured Psychroserpens sp.]